MGTIDVGVANDNIADYLRFGATAEFGDIVTNFDVSRTNDLVQFSGALRTAHDDGATDGAFMWSQGNKCVGIGSSNVTVGQGSTDREGLLLRSGDGLSTANLDSASAVAAAFSAEFNITAANGEDAVLVINNTSGNGFSVRLWVQAGGGEVSAAELTLIGVFQSNAAVTSSSFGFV